MSSELLPLHQLYFKYVSQKIFREKPQGLYAIHLWGTIPSNIYETSLGLEKIRRQYTPNAKLEDLQKIIKNNLHSSGLLTHDTADCIERLSEGVIEVGQQPNCLGGPSSIFNKICFAVFLAKRSSASPFFFVADYDDARPELLYSRIPSLAPQGMNITTPVHNDFEGAPIHTLEKPTEEWLQSNLSKIEESYRTLLRGTSRFDRCMQNLHQIFTVIRLAYFSSNTFSEFSTKIIGTVTNLISDLALPIYCFSIPESRRIFQEGYELLLLENNRKKFIDVANQTVESITQSGYKPQIGAKPKDYVPFYLECPKCGRARVELRLSSESTGIGVLTGDCPKCKVKHTYSFNSNKPDLTDIVQYLTPRVDSRQIIIDSVVPVLAHVVGPSETSYFAEVIPTARALRLPFPMVVRYSRLFYNTPWVEKVSQELRNYPELGKNNVYDVLSKWVKLKMSEDPQSISLIHKEMQLALASRSHNIDDQLIKIEQQIKDLRDTNTEERENSFKLVQVYQKQKRSLQLLRSWAYGVYTLNKFGQEVNWNWIDLAIVTGVDDLAGTYSRFYNDFTPNASTFFINT